jgi:hypothetical protein
MKSFPYRLLAKTVAAATLILVGCAQAAPSPSVSATQAPLLDDLAAQCGLACPAKGIADGNAQISGVASVDAFFASVVSFQATGAGVADDLSAQLGVIRADFGIAQNADFATQLKAQISANLTGGLTVESEPAQCSVDTQVTLDAAARCDASVDPGKATLACKGECELQANAEAKCAADADLECTVAAPAVTCAEQCKGSCKLQLATAAKCDGLCDGACDGKCDGYARDQDGKFHAHGRCSGMCTGSCKRELALAAKCQGECEGECTTQNPTVGCKNQLHASCRSRANAMVNCEGRCQGEFVPPKAKAECEASATADAKINVLCTPPRLVIRYDLKAVVVGSAEATAQAKFVDALGHLQVRLPMLLASAKRAHSVADAGAGLIVAANAAVKASIKLTIKGDLKPKQAIGLACAVAQLDDVDSAVSGTNTKLTASLTQCTSVTTAFGLTG